ncbi:MAG: hypothetical protein HYY04_02430 [Chloroflexi bacterium]|nr:hypothetical protein [Chloroflexota bacterium]
MSRFSVVVFQTVVALWPGHVEEKGGGVAFFPVDERNAWPALLDEIVRQRFRHSLGRTVEVGIALLDEDQLRRHCHQHRGAFWQGGDRD